MNKKISFVVLLSFLVNTAVSDVAFSQNTAYNTNQDNLAAPLYTDDIAGIQHKDMGRIKFALKEQLVIWKNQHIALFDTAAPVSIDNMTAGLVEQSVKEKTIFQSADMQFFFSEMQVVNANPCVRVRLKDKDGDRIYYTVFSLKKGKDSHFPIAVYTEKAYQAMGGFKKGLPQRNPVDILEVDRYAQNNEEAIDAYTRERIGEGDFAEIKGRAKGLNWERRFPDAIKPKVYFEDFLGKDQHLLAFLNVFGVTDRGAFEGKNIIFIKVPKTIGYPAIVEDGREIPVKSRTSEDAVYFFLDNHEFEDLKCFFGKDPQDYKTFHYIHFINRVIHEIGVIYGLPYEVTENGEIVNELDKAHDDLVPKGLNIMGPQLLARHPILANLAKANLGHVKDRDYADGKATSAPASAASPISAAALADAARARQIIEKLRESLEKEATGSYPQHANYALFEMRESAWAVIREGHRELYYKLDLIFAELRSRLDSTSHAYGLAEVEAVNRSADIVWNGMREFDAVFKLGFLKTSFEHNGLVTEFEVLKRNREFPYDNRFIQFHLQKFLNGKGASADSILTALRNSGSTVRFADGIEVPTERESDYLINTSTTALIDIIRFSISYQSSEEVFVVGDIRRAAPSAPAQANTAATQRPGKLNMTTTAPDGPQDTAAAAAASATPAPVTRTKPATVHIKLPNTTPSGMNFIDLAVEVGRRDIPTHPNPTELKDKQYTLLVAGELFKGDEFDKDRSERFELDKISGTDESQLMNSILGRVKGEAKRTIILIKEGSLSKDKLTELTGSGVRFVMIGVEEFTEAISDTNATSRREFRKDAYAMMLLIRRLDGSLRDNPSFSALLGFYLSSHFTFADGMTAAEYVTAIVNNDVARLIRGYLTYRPAEPNNIPEYHQVAASLMSA